MDVVKSINRHSHNAKRRRPEGRRRFGLLQGLPTGILILKCNHNQAQQLSLESHLSVYHHLDPQKLC